MRQKTYKQIEESRNRRLWITTVALPTATLVATVLNNDQIRADINLCVDKAYKGIKNTCSKVKEHFENKKKEKEDK